MIKFENTEVVGWEHAIRGMRNPMNSWDKSDSCFVGEDWHGVDGFVIGENDLCLANKLAKAGTEHRKFMRMLTVYVDITAPLYWVPEHDTYKVGTVRNSCSFMHKGVSKPFCITDFSVSDDRLYKILSPICKDTVELTYIKPESDYRIYTTENGRKYKIYSNGKVYRESFTLLDKCGRLRTFEEKEVIPSKTPSGYFEVNIGGRSGEKWLLHRLIATVWIDNPENLETVNHIDANKGNNDISNLEWMSREDNIKAGFDLGLYDKNALHKNYIAWKNGHTNVSPIIKQRIRIEHKNGLNAVELATKYKVSKTTINNILFGADCEDSDLFYTAYMYERLLDNLNNLRDEYLLTGDSNVFLAIRELLPQGYNIRYTWCANYEVLANIYKSRKNHRLPEWRSFCDWIKTLPYSELITGDF